MYRWISLFQIFLFPSYLLTNYECKFNEMVSFFCRQLATFLSNGGNINERNLIWRDFCRLRNPQRCNKTIKGPKAKVGPSKLLFLQPLIMRHDITLTLERKILHFHLNRNSKDLWRFFLH